MQVSGDLKAKVEYLNGPGRWHLKDYCVTWGDVTRMDKEIACEYLALQSIEAQRDTASGWWKNVLAWWWDVSARSFVRRYKRLLPA